MKEKFLRWLVNRDIVKSGAEFGTNTLPEIAENWNHVEIPDVTQRYVAGKEVETAVDYVEERNQQGISAIVNKLGEHIEGSEQVENVRNQYLELLNEIDENDLDASLSVKPSQLGLDIDRDLCRENLEDLAERSGEIDSFFWIDMESKDYKDTTVDIYRDLNEQFDDVGLCLQAYLNDTEEDLELLQQEDATIRLVKGAYDSDSDFKTDEQVDNNYVELMEDLFNGDNYFALGTHDLSILEKADELESETGNDNYEVQFLKGVYEDEIPGIVEDKEIVEYVPYGGEAFEYFWRRVEEHPQNIKYGIETVIDANRPILPENI